MPWPTQIHASRTAVIRDRDSGKMVRFTGASEQLSGSPVSAQRMQAIEDRPVQLDGDHPLALLTNGHREDEADYDPAAAAAAASRAAAAEDAAEQMRARERRIAKQKRLAARAAGDGGDASSASGDKDGVAGSDAGPGAGTDAVLAVADAAANGAPSSPGGDASALLLRGTAQKRATALVPIEAPPRSPPLGGGAATGSGGSVVAAAQAGGSGSVKPRKDKKRGSKAIRGGKHAPKKGVGADKVMAPLSSALVPVATEGGSDADANADKASSLGWESSSDEEEDDGVQEDEEEEGGGAEEAKGSGSVRIVLPKRKKFRATLPLQKFLLYGHSDVVYRVRDAHVVVPSLVFASLSCSGGSHMFFVVVLWLSQVKFTPDGGRMVTASHDMTCRLWQLKPLGALGWGGGACCGARFSAQQPCHPQCNVLAHHVPAPQCLTPPSAPKWCP